MRTMKLFAIEIQVIGGQYEAEIYDINKTRDIELCEGLPLPVQCAPETAAKYQTPQLGNRERAAPHFGMREADFLQDACSETRVGYHHTFTNHSRNLE